MSWKLKKTILRVASCSSRVESLNDKLTSWKFKMIKFTSCEVAFYKFNIYDVNFTNYHHMVESNFKRINLRKLYEKAISIKCILTLDNSNTH